MSILVITNNKKTVEKLEQFRLRVEYLEAEPSVILRYARDRVMENWRLAADPLAAYNKRYFPYHTVFLTDDYDNTDNGCSDILRLENAANHWLDGRRPEKENTQRIREDYACIDSDIALHIAEKLPNSSFL